MIVMKPTIALIVLAVFAAGCTGVFSKKSGSGDPDRRLGSEAPAFGSAPEYETVAGFISGWWTPSDSIDMALAEAIGMEQIAEEQNSDETIFEIYVFNSDGTFYYTEPEAKWKLGGTWQEVEGGLQITYSTYNGKSLREAQDEAKKEAEKGFSAGVVGDLHMDRITKHATSAPTYLVLHEDGKRVAFAFRDQDSGELIYDTVLERLGS